MLFGEAISMIEVEPLFCETSDTFDGGAAGPLRKAGTALYFAAPDTV